MQYLKKASKTPSTDDHKTRETVQKILSDIEKRRAERTQAQMFMVQAQAAANGQQNPNAEQMSEEFEKAMKEGYEYKTSDK